MTLHGWDMSLYDAPSVGNAIAQGIQFITHKAGGDQADPELAAWWQGVRPYGDGIVLGAYWVLYPGDPVGRADAFLARLDSQCPGWRERDVFALQIDAEEWNNNPATRPSIAECNAFGDRLKAKTGYVPLGYLPKWVYPNVASFKYPIWASSYVTGSGPFKSLYPGDSSPNWAPYGKPVTLLQYSSSATIGGQTFSDANAFRGTIDQLKALIAPGKVFNMPLTDADKPIIEAAAKQGVADAFGDSGLWGQQFEANINRAIDAAMTDGPLAASLAAQGTAISSLVALVQAEHQITAEELSAALLPALLAAIAALPTGTGGITEAQAEQAIRNVLGGLNDAA